MRYTIWCVLVVQTFTRGCTVESRNKKRNRKRKREREKEKSFVGECLVSNQIRVVARHSCPLVLRFSFATNLCRSVLFVPCFVSVLAICECCLVVDV